MRPRFPIVLAVIAALSTTSVAFAFDTGHHADLTREAMLAEGFGQPQANVVLVVNWMTDYYSHAYSRQDDLSLLHFDNLTSTAAVKNYWDTFTLNSYTAVTNAAKQQDIPKLLALLGLSLHTVQDFYSHSNWVELSQPALQGAPYATSCWFDLPPDQRAMIGLRTGGYPNSNPIAGTDHGGYDSGMNHDSYCRPRWDEAYVYAYAASRHWIRTFAQWTNAARPGLWAAVQSRTFSGSDQTELASDQLAAYRISEWISPAVGENGHWKGKGSGSNSDFASFAAGYKLKQRSRFARFITDNQWDLELSKGLANPTPPTTPLPAVAPWRALDQRAVIVRTISVRESQTGTWESRMDSGFSGAPDFYALVTVDNLTFVEAMQLDKASIKTNWCTIRFVPTSQSSSSIRYVLYDEDNPPSNADDSCDVNPIKDVTDLNLTFDLSSGVIRGVSPASGDLESEGATPDADRARVQLSVLCVPLRDVPPPADSIVSPTPITNLDPDGVQQPGLASSGRAAGDGYWFEWRNLVVSRIGLHVEFALDLRGGSTRPTNNSAVFQMSLDNTNVTAPVYSGGPIMDFKHFQGAIDAPADAVDSREVGMSLVGYFPNITSGDGDGDGEDIGSFSVPAFLGTLFW